MIFIYMCNFKVFMHNIQRDTQWKKYNWWRLYPPPLTPNSRPPQKNPPNKQTPPPHPPKKIKNKNPKQPKLTTHFGSHFSYTNSTQSDVRQMILPAKCYMQKVFTLVVPYAMLKFILSFIALLDISPISCWQLLYIFLRNKSKLSIVDVNLLHQILIWFEPYLHISIL